MYKLNPAINTFAVSRFLLIFIFVFRQYFAQELSQILCRPFGGIFMRQYLNIVIINLLNGRSVPFSVFIAENIPYRKAFIPAAAVNP